MKRTSAAALAIAAVISAAPAHAGTQFLAYQGTDAVKQGRGGDMKTVDSIDFWLDGSPPHRFQVLGALEDERMKTGLFGLIRMSSLEHDMARIARQAGGDAVILTGAQDNLQGVVGGSFGSVSGTSFGGPGFATFSGSGSSTSYARPVESHASRYVVVKYLPDGPATDSAPAWSAAPPSPLDAPPPAVTASRF
jgi:hypothetical protein